jgi:hypothetical protein
MQRLLLENNRLRDEVAQLRQRLAEAVAAGDAAAVVAAESASTTTRAGGTAGGGASLPMHRDSATGCAVFTRSDAAAAATPGGPGAAGRSQGASGAAVRSASQPRASAVESALAVAASAREQTTLRFRVQQAEAEAERLRADAIKLAQENEALLKDADATRRVVATQAARLAASTSGLGASAGAGAGAVTGPTVLHADSLMPDGAAPMRAAPYTASILARYATSLGKTAEREARARGSAERALVAVSADPDASIASSTDGAGVEAQLRRSLQRAIEAATRAENTAATAELQARRAAEENGVLSARLSESEAALAEVRSERVFAETRARQAYEDLDARRAAAEATATEAAARADAATAQAAQATSTLEEQRRAAAREKQETQRALDRAAAEADRAQQLERASSLRAAKMEEAIAGTLAEADAARAETDALRAALEDERTAAAAARAQFATQLQDATECVVHYIIEPRDGASGPASKGARTAQEMLDDLDDEFGLGAGSGGGSKTKDGRPRVVVVRRGPPRDVALDPVAEIADHADECVALLSHENGRLAEENERLVEERAQWAVERAQLCDAVEGLALDLQAATALATERSK